MVALPSPPTALHLKEKVYSAAGEKTRACDELHSFYIKYTTKCLSVYFTYGLSLEFAALVRIESI